MNNQTECTKKITKISINRYKNIYNTTHAIIVYKSVKNDTSQVDITKKVGISKDIVKCVLQSYKKTGSHMAVPRPGRSLKLNERDKREIMLQINHDPTQPMSTIARTLSTPVPVKTLRKFFHKAGIYSQKMILKPKILEINHKNVGVTIMTSTTTLSQYEYVLICDKSNTRVSGSPQNICTGKQQIGIPSSDLMSQRSSSTEVMGTGVFSGQMARALSPTSSHQL
ncbi:Homeodomain-like DNA binding domain-containing transcription factor [Phycomyces blakesleeanus NRRL 1555(-)]|uniref:Homeodomain-like DNA binding domain-containing transcription factor n=1 Tax=Phycomyces blakesleeanus (strain ATCC 8743b / DSM 1359 / FGSC 10004 / NBRC 33097 / NRRL 1555) TaxID=763407 RepID=A0A167MK83_PHYB8|nr:Homeodomain-like DNA binding domain-containing transcription factor [Phycomyces blakesleeanus NRRL 1555(-)]OAD73086.1 Homeodomain-like DNA binding domain-containing transcription factor [Phycomyces blakesleeanus NRRL 1555(-)]|eukprot:XP_018291126.1 Homeodomain-like DNA binding domain-containing transcription factor [Phycomyces blakesleeanus NRRL 1555(-)]